MKPIVVRNGGDIASGIIHRLYMSGYKVVVLEIEKPLTIRRTVSFSEAVYNGETTVEGVRAILAKSLDSIYQILEEGHIPIYVDGQGDIIRELKPLAVVDAIIAKKNLGTNRKMAPITIGVGPGFEAGAGVDLVVESQRGHNLGKVIHKGKPASNTGIPGDILGYREERVIRANADGVIKTFYNIGDMVEKEDILAQIGEEVIIAQIGGILRGMIKEGTYVKKGLKIGDIDPRGVKEYAFTISDKARAIGGGVLEGIQYLLNKQ